ncbi:hypothetical protein JQ629_14050 [Bradyrhizobium sp. AUGA SZCCT0222]|uniref:hypothetical protein n=1 Tax=Bradyrhizobium sp. AUGA SZCCT0222 TaxID=2807668 RepID=UPI001BA67667|nr:hypothetical protein [Bradyrhizobium sp. AUGA SZCCT0222]MBR1268637.1 hypothetical protein [Bradyrhizobium sp. AUGA SZCCT0222]
MAGQEGLASAHHTTNVYLQQSPKDEISAESKGLGLLSNGSVVRVTYTERLRRTAGAWQAACIRFNQHRAEKRGMSIVNL